MPKLGAGQVHIMERKSNPAVIAANAERKAAMAFHISDLSEMRFIWRSIHPEGLLSGRSCNIALLIQAQPDNRAKTTIVD